MSYYRSLRCGILILVFLVLGELSLNAMRALLKGQLFSSDGQALKSQLVIKPDQENGFPFNSKVISIDDYKSKDVKLWVSSASHAADHHGTKSQFPNFLCDFLENENCYVLNASTPGVLLEGNIEFLENKASDWGPDYVLLYQAYLDIHHSTRLPSAFEVRIDNKENFQRIADRVKEKLHIEKLLRNTILRNYSRNYLGSSFLLATPLLESFPEIEREAFESRLNRFVAQSKSIGATPILVTFVSAHGDSEGVITLGYKTWLMRYFENYSPETVNNLISEYNDLIREVGLQQGVEVIDLDKEWAAADRKGGFDDFVHFSKSGHRKVARIIAKNLNGIIK